MKNLIEKILPHDLWNISGDFGKVNEDSFYEKTDVYEINSHCN